MTRYLVIFERTATGWSTWSPDVPGCIATGPTRGDAEANMREAMESHVGMLREEGAAVPEPRSEGGYVEIAA